MNEYVEWYELPYGIKDETATPITKVTLKYKWKKLTTGQMKNQVSVNFGLPVFGGTCSCPNGINEYAAATDESCEELACDGGTKISCNMYEMMTEWSHRNVICAPTTSAQSYTTFETIFSKPFRNEPFIRLNYQSNLISLSENCGWGAEKYYSKNVDHIEAECLICTSSAVDNFYGVCLCPDGGYSPARAGMFFKTGQLQFINSEEKYNYNGNYIIGTCWKDHNLKEADNVNIYCLSKFKHMFGLETAAVMIDDFTYDSVAETTYATYKIKIWNKNLLTGDESNCLDYVHILQS